MGSNKGNSMNFLEADYSEITRAMMRSLPTALIIILAAVLLYSVLKRALKLLTRRTSFTEKELDPVRRAIKWIITIAAFVLVLGAFGANVGGLWGVLSTILAMIAIGFVAVWSILSNVLCTLFIIIFRTFAVGDEIEFAGEPVKGRVTDLNFIFTTLDAGDGTVIQIPNNLFFQRVLKRRHAAYAVSAATHLRSKQPETTATQPHGAAVPAPAPVEPTR